MPGIPFTKASACGNDFLIIDGAHLPADAAAFTRNICDRHDGIGADGVEWIFPGKEGADVECRLINADGSAAEVSGNGTRCVAAWWHSRQSGQQRVVNVLTGAGAKECRVVSAAGTEYQFEMKIGVPQIAGERKLALSSGEVSGLQLNMGNPQFVVFVDNFDFPWQARGAEIQAQSQHFPEGTNVDFVRVTGPDRIEARFFERGAGETRSSGTGSCASAVAAIHLRGVKSPVTVVAPGGSQEGRWEKEVFLTGPARLIGEGTFFI